MDQIIILEDEEPREEVMGSLLSQNYPDLKTVFFDKSHLMNQYLRDHHESAVVISLDHDLPLYRDSEGQLFDHGTGRQVADFLSSLTPVCTVGIHSTNIPAAIGMEQQLLEHNWEVFRITPYGDLEWIEELWFPKIKEAIEKKEN